MIMLRWHQPNEILKTKEAAAAGTAEDVKSFEVGDDDNAQLVLTSLHRSPPSFTSFEKQSNFFKNSVKVPP